jgi:catechol 2,3-dioxygenase-like lactoylglutathione lyase family enzyme
MSFLPVRQIAYFVPDVRVAALNHHRRFGSGPYFVADNVPLCSAIHRGVETPLDHSSAYGQWGEVMIEFVQQNNSGRSAFHDMYPEGSGRFGFHHVALFADDTDAACAQYATDGFETAFRAEMNDGFVYAFVDAVAEYGHMIELYQPLPQLTGFYDMVADAAKSFKGGDVIETIRFE